MMKRLALLERKRRLAWGTATLAGAGLLAGGVAWACADSSCYPDWRLSLASYDCAGQAMLSPGNDTRVNMLWLMRSLSETAPRGPAPTPSDERQFGQTWLSWSGLRAALWPAPEAKPAEDAQPASSCQTFATAVPAFNEALAADKGVPEAERKALGQWRAKVGCGDVAWDGPSIASPAGRDYLAYLKASQAFYSSDWAGARQGFAPLARSKSRWIAETAAYMPIRIALRAAIAGAVDKYGDFAGTDKVDPASVAAAREAIATYLKAWPQGRYAASATGLLRRVAWLGGDDAGLAQTYEQMLATTPGDSEAAADLAEEIDIKLFERQNADAILDRLNNAPLLLAVADFKRMRRFDDGTASTKGGLPDGQLAAQKGQFAQHPDLYGLLEATRAFYAGDNPRGILTMLPDAARAKSFTPVAFSRQMLRGMALAKAHDPNEAGFWQELLTGASPFYQRPLVQMGLVLRWQRDGKLAQVFAPGSPITDSMTREILLQTMATPAILRGSAQDASRPAHERDIARFTLLYKDLAKGAYGDFGGDLALVPAHASAEDHLWNFSMQETIPVGLFSKGKWADGNIACGPLSQTAAALARSPVDRKAQLCLGEFYRLNGFDGFSLYRPDPKRPGLGSGPEGFPGRLLSRGELYAAVIADPKALPDERAYALYRAVMCYAPSGYNGCSASVSTNSLPPEVPKEQRKAWYNELKQRYPASTWAKSLRYYW
ncbi:hypothetical protein [Novosphingobium rosa]|uniref:hypothetical protein n=1 Tax=Novosphingobium rosa TaxID=76978 RepID=UPI001FE1EE6D|nr:hypothetical protein [Novosphingobium rosa]